MRNGGLIVNPGTMMHPGGPVVSAPPTAAVLQAHWDFSDISTLFQDTARTIPITTNGQIIRGVTDLTGNGNHLDDGGGSGVDYLAAVQNGLSAASNVGASGKYLDESTGLTLGSPHSMIIVAKNPSTQQVSFESSVIGGQACLANSSGMGSCAAVQTCGTFYQRGNNPVTLSVVDPTFVADVWHIWVIDFDGVNNPTYIENVFDVNQGGGVHTHTVGIRVMHDCNLGSGQWNSQAGEIFLYDTGALGAAFRIFQVNALKTKWNI